MKEVIPSLYLNVALCMLILIIESIGIAATPLTESDDSELEKLQQQKARSILGYIDANQIVPLIKHKKTTEHTIKKRCTNGCVSSRHRHHHHHHQPWPNAYSGPMMNPYPGSMMNPYPGPMMNPYPNYGPYTFNQQWPMMNQIGFQPYLPRYRRSLSLFDIKRRNKDLTSNKEQSYEVIFYYEYSSH